VGRTSFKQLESQLREIPHEVLMPIGKIAPALTALIESRKIDLLVLGTMAAPAWANCSSVPWPRKFSAARLVPL